MIRFVAAAAVAAVVVAVLWNVTADSSGSGGAPDRQGQPANAPSQVDAVPPLEDDVGNVADSVFGREELAAAATALPPPVVRFVVGGTETYDGALVAVGNRDRPGDQVRIEVLCPDGFCDPEDVRIDVGGTIFAGQNPLIVGVHQQGEHTVRVDVAGRPSPQRGVVVGADRTIDWPADSWGDGAWPDPKLAATLWAETTQLLPACSPFPSQDQRRCVEPSEITVIGDGSVVTVPDLEDPDGNVVDPLACDSGWRYEFTDGMFSVVPGIADGCVTIEMADQAFARTFGEGLDVDDGNSADPATTPVGGEAVGLPSDWLTVGELAVFLAAATGPDFASPPPVQFTPATGTAGDTVTVTAALHPGVADDTTDGANSQEPPVTVDGFTWPEPEGTQRLCEPQATFVDGPPACKYLLREPQQQHVQVPIITDGADNGAAATFAVVADPPRPTVTVTDVTYLDGSDISVWTVTSTQPLRSATMSPQHNNVTVAVGPARRTVTVTVTGQVNVSVDLCAAAACDTVTIDTTVADPPRTSFLAVHATSGVAQVPLPAGNWTLRNPPSGMHARVIQGDALEVAVPDIVAPGTGPLFLDLDTTSGDALEVCVQLPAGPSCPAPPPTTTHADTGGSSETPTTGRLSTQTQGMNHG